MLVVTALLFLRSLEKAAHTDPGFTTANIQIASVDVSLSGYREQQAVALAERFLERLQGIAGVESVAHARMIPLQGSGFGLGSVRVAGANGHARATAASTPTGTSSRPDTSRRSSMPIVEGRAFSAIRSRRGAVGRDHQRDVRPAGVAGPVGDRPDVHAASRVTAKSAPSQIVGVARDAKYRYISSAERAVHLRADGAAADSRRSSSTSGTRPAARSRKEIRTAMAQVEPNVPIVMLQSFDDAAAIGLLPQKLAAWIAGSVGTIGIFLAALGLYGLMAFLVAQRTREIAIRMALGASNTRHARDGAASRRACSARSAA